MLYERELYFLTIFVITELTRWQLGWWTLELGVILRMGLGTVMLVLGIRGAEEGLLTKHSGGIL